MHSETAFLAGLRRLATHPAARGLADDAAVFSVAALGPSRHHLVISHDMMVEGVHWLRDADPADVAWKLVASNLSDLAAKGATPVGMVLGYMLAADAGWNERFLTGLGDALAHFSLPLLGGDTVAPPRSAPRPDAGPGSMPAGASARALGATVIGQARVAPRRGGVQPGDALYVIGAIGLAGQGLQLLTGTPAAALGLDAPGAAAAIRAHQRPVPLLAEGVRLAPFVHAMMDVSDGLLIDAQRMAAASGLAITLLLDQVPVAGDPLAAIVAGDDYALLFAAPPSTVLPLPARRIGHAARGSGLHLLHLGEPLPLPERLGWEHAAA